VFVSLFVCLFDCCCVHLQAASQAAVQVSCLDEAHQGRLAAAAQCLAGATHLHIRVLEDMLQQESTGADLSKQQQGAAEGAAVGVAAALAAEDGTAHSLDVWAACLQLQADVDLAVAQMCNIHL
jgi:hypothetical protein